MSQGQKATAEEIRAAVSIIPREADSEWDAVTGKPTVAAVNARLDGAVATLDDIEEAMGSGFKRPEMHGALTADRLAAIEPPKADEQRSAVKTTRAELLDDAIAELKAYNPELDEIARQKQALAQREAELAKKSDAAQRKIAALTDSKTHAEIVAKIQKDDQERLAANAAAQHKMREAMGLPEGATYASPLDAALASGRADKRSVILRDGQVIAAPHPRSPEGVAAMANWIHHNNGSRS